MTTAVDIEIDVLVRFPGRDIYSDPKARITAKAAKVFAAAVRAMRGSASMIVAPIAAIA